MRCPLPSIFRPALCCVHHASPLLTTRPTDCISALAHAHLQWTSRRLWAAPRRSTCCRRASCRCGQVRATAASPPAALASFACAGLSAQLHAAPAAHIGRGLRTGECLPVSTAGPPHAQLAATLPCMACMQAALWCRAPPSSCCCSSAAGPAGWRRCLAASLQVGALWQGSGQPEGQQTAGRTLQADHSAFAALRGQKTSCMHMCTASATRPKAGCIAPGHACPPAPTLTGYICACCPAPDCSRGDCHGGQLFPCGCARQGCGAG